MRRTLLNLAAATAASAIILGACLYVLTTMPLGYVVAIAASIGLIWLSR
jgi:uncharacterized membrane protein YbjE (DUF340 family)